MTPHVIGPTIGAGGVENGVVERREEGKKRNGNIGTGAGTGTGTGTDTGSSEVKSSIRSGKI